MKELQIENDVNIPENNTNENNLPVVPEGPLEIALGDTKIEFNNVEATEEDRVLFVRQCIRSKVLKMFGVSEVNKTPVSSGSLYFNNNRTSMKLPKVKTNSDGAFTENLEQYYERAKPYIKLWLTQSLQNASITVEMVEAIK